jgi:hypothetical protein
VDVSIQQVVPVSMSPAKAISGREKILKMAIAANFALGMVAISFQWQ